MKIIVAGVTSLPPYSPGIAWDWLQVACGFRLLGHDVYYVEEVEPGWCFGRNGEKCSYEASWNKQLFTEMMQRFDLFEHSCQVYNGGENTTGMSCDALKQVAKDSDLLVNMSGHVKTEWILEPVKVRAYVDQDPVYTQLWNAEYDKPLDFDRHNVFFTVGLNIGTERTPIPDCGIKWHHLRPPVVTDFWTPHFDASAARFTTIASWCGYDDLLYQGQWYRSKYVEFLRFAELPGRVNQEMEIALKNYRLEDPGVQQLLENGWVLSAAERQDSLTSYQDFIARSRGEIGIAQNAYVQGRSGWFSDRASHYLASGKPVLAQATGFEEHLPTGLGLIPFANIDEAVDGMDRINSNYKAHCEAARELALEHLDYTKVLPGMLAAAGSVP
jgi:hypothetical protein